MPTKHSKEDLLKIENLPDAVKADLLALFTDVEERDTQIKDLQKKNEDADAVVKRAPALEKLNKEQAAQIELLNGKLTQYTGKQVDEVGGGMFQWLFDILEGK